MKAYFGSFLVASTLLSGCVHFGLSSILLSRDALDVAYVEKVNPKRCKRMVEMVGNPGHYFGWRGNDQARIDLRNRAAVEGFTHLVETDSSWWFGYVKATAYKCR